MNHIIFSISILAVGLLYLDLAGYVIWLGSNSAQYSLAVGLLIPISLLFLGYVDLRNTWTYIQWFVLALVMLFMYYHFRDLPQLQLKRGSALRSFKSLFFYLITFLIARGVFNKFLGREYVTPSIGGSSDLLEGQRPQMGDFITFAILLFVIIYSQDL